LFDHDIGVKLITRHSDIAETVMQYFQPTTEDERQVDDNDNMSLLEKMVLWARNATVLDPPDGEGVEFDIDDVAEDPPEGLRITSSGDVHSSHRQVTGLHVAIGQSPHRCCSGTGQF